MSDELKLREAAERVRDYAEWLNDDDGVLESPYRVMPKNQWGIDRHRLERFAIKTLLAAREGEEEAYGKWLRSIGGVRPMATASDEVYAFGDYRKFSDSFGCYPVMFRRHRKGGWTACVYGQDQLMPLTTRGQVLALLTALGITPKEQSDET